VVINGGARARGVGPCQKIFVRPSPVSQVRAAAAAAAARILRACSNVALALRYLLVGTGTLY
jgi:hypothetical protein